MSTQGILDWGHAGVGGEAGINVHTVLPVTTPRGKQMMPPADWIYDPGQGAKNDFTDTGDDFLAIGPALRIMLLNVEGLSAAKREVISSIAERQKIDVICLEEPLVIYNCALYNWKLSHRLRDIRLLSIPSPWNPG